jgi:hypothetical protein
MWTLIRYSSNFAAEPEYFDHAIYGEHDKPVACYANPGKDSLTSKPSFQTKTVAPGEIEDRYRHANPEQGVSYPMFSLEDLYFDGLILKHAGFDLAAYRGRHGQSLQMATDYYACFAKSAGPGKQITSVNAKSCPDFEQYLGQNVSDAEKNMLLGAWEFPQDKTLTELVPAAEARPDGRALDAIQFGLWPN